MKSLEKRNLDIIVELLDNEGTTRPEIIEKTGLWGSNASKRFGELMKDGILYCEKDVAKKKARGLYTADFYYLGPKNTASSDEKLDIFQLILRSFLEEQKTDLQEKLLASEYVNSLIATCGLKSFYEIIEEYMERKEFQRIASRALLSQPAFIEDYIKLPVSMKEHLGSDETLIKLRILFSFDAKESVMFYRKYLAYDFVKLYRDLEESDVTQFMDFDIIEAIMKFLEYDFHLSPITSFPQNHPIELLLAKPFERLYNDVYICDDMDYEIMARRAYLIYSHFAEILRIGIIYITRIEYRWDSLNRALSKSKEDYEQTRKFNFIRLLRWDLFSKKQNLPNLIKELIFYWNIASLRLDFIYCKQRYWKKRWGHSTEAYHLLANSNGIQAIHIDENKSTGPEMTNEDMIVTSLWSGDSDPFSNLRYCYCFKDLNLKEKHVSVKEIASALENIDFG
jgi:hypothetical protein